MKHMYILILSILILSGCKQIPEPVTFAIITDIHQDIMHDGEDRLQIFLKAAEANQVDFIIDLGDFCFPKEENKTFLQLWNNYPGESYHVLGNHDMDICSKEEYMAFTGMPARYYSFDKGDFHFVVLDANTLYMEGEYIPYDKGNYFIETPDKSVIDPEQMEWLQKDLAATPHRCIIFSHQSLENTVANGEAVRQILEEENKKAGFKKIPVAFSGHDHTNYTREINGITYIQINSASNQWVGSEYACPERFDEETNQKRPALQYTLPYQDALYAIITLDQQGMDLKGIESSFIPPLPWREDENPEELFPTPVVPYIKDFRLIY